MELTCKLQDARYSNGTSISGVKHKTYVHACSSINLSTSVSTIFLAYRRPKSGYLWQTTIFSLLPLPSRWSVVNVAQRQILVNVTHSRIQTIDFSTISNTSADSPSTACIRASALFICSLAWASYRFQRVNGVSKREAS